MRPSLRWIVAAISLVALEPLAGADGVNVAVFNFQMKSERPDWKWLEKGLADRVITDFFQEKSISVIQRDAMQQLADQMSWVPEMMYNPSRLDAIHKALAPDYLVSGLYEVKAGELTITATVIKFETKKEVARREVTGPSSEALELTRRLSASLIGWLTKRKEEEILRELPGWTRSIPAAQALYEGMHLYDQGRYGEAWLKFRQASGRDRGYVEAQYWVGRMYYFMDRYLHARRAFERFVYYNRVHPRLGDAIKEYLHTYEKLDTPPQTMLRLYGHLAERHGDVKVYGVMSMAWLVNRLWLWTKSAQTLGRLGRYDEAVELAAKVVDQLSGPRDNPYRRRHLGGMHAYSAAMGNAQTLNMLTGRALMPEGLARHYPAIPLRFRPGLNVVESHWPRPFRMMPTSLGDGRTYWSPNFAWWFVVAPDGHYFKELHFYPVVEKYGSENVRLGIVLHKDDYMDVSWSDGGQTVRESAAKGRRFTDLPRGGLFHVHMFLQTSQLYEADPGAYIKGIRAIAKLEKIGPHGAINITCASTSEFRAELDGRMGRKGPGLIGLVPPGKHKLRVVPADASAPYGAWTGQVDVAEGQIAKVHTALPWKKGSPWAGWQAALIGRDYAVDQFNVEFTLGCPALQADGEAIRCVWGYIGDLWWSVSGDGRQFTRPARLPMPISSGWQEWDPLLIRDESGKFMLAFLSDRNAQREPRIYACWSRDFVHWSAPAMIIDRPVMKFDLIQDSRGRYICVADKDNACVILVSRDGYRWTQAGRVPLGGPCMGVRILQDGQGLYHLLVGAAVDKWPARDVDLTRTHVLHLTSSDLARWGDRRDLANFRGRRRIYLSAMAAEGSFLLACSRQQHFLARDFVQLFRRKPDGAWSKSPVLFGVTPQSTVITWHPRWKYMVCSVQSPTGQFPTKFQGPFFLRGESVEPLFAQESQTPGKGT